MFEELPAAGHVLAVRFSGTLTGGDIRQCRGILADRLARHERVSSWIDCRAMADVNAEALGEGMKADLELLGHLRQLARCAVVSDKEWPRAAIRLIGPVFPTFEMRAFPPDQSDLAMRWAEELPEAPERGPAFRFLATSREDVLAFEIDGVISSEEMPAVIRTFEAFLARHQKVRLLNRVKHFGGIDPAVLMQEGLVPVKLAAIRKLERYAIVGAPGWMRKIAQAVSPALDLEIRTFATDQEDAAWAWLGAEPARWSAFTPGSV